MRPRAVLALLAAALLVWGAPLAGLALAGRPLAPYLEFPPRTEAVAHAPFSWLAFALLSLPVLAAAALYASGPDRARLDGCLEREPRTARMAARVLHAALGRLRRRHERARGPAQRTLAAHAPDGGVAGPVSPQRRPLVAVPVPEPVRGPIVLQR